MILGNGGNKNIIDVTKLFSNIFGNTSGVVLNVCPASVVLLGDHTHYNDGILISACVDKYWTFMVKKRKDCLINIVSTESENLTTINLEKPFEGNIYSFKLLRGLINILKEENLLNIGFDCVVSSTVPECLGLGSQAAQQVGFLNSIKKLFSLDITDEKLLSFVLKNELNIIGKISNVAHHYTVQFGKEKKIFSIDLRTKEYKTFSIDRDDYSLVICDSGEKIESPESICNERIEECEIGVKGLRLYIWGVRNLRDIELEFLHRHYHMLPKRIFNRVLYNVKERTRAELAIKYLRKKSYAEFGKLIIESNKNLFEDYELQNEHSDFLIKESSHLEGVVGSKMISCSPIRSTFNLVADNKIDKFIFEMKNSFEKKFQRQLKTYVVKLTGGTKKIPLKEIEFSLQ
jgi:galactokinase